MNGGYQPGNSSPSRGLFSFRQCSLSSWFLTQSQMRGENKIWCPTVGHFGPSFLLREDKIKACASYNNCEAPCTGQS